MPDNESRLEMFGYGFEREGIPMGIKTIASGSAVPGGIVELSARSGPGDDATRQSLKLLPPSDRQ